MDKFFKNNFLSFSLISIFLNFFILLLFKLCHLHNFLFAKDSQGNFSPGSFFLYGAISECPNTFSNLILYFLIKYFNIFLMKKVA